MDIPFSPYEQRLNFQEMRESLEERCERFQPDAEISLAHIVAYNLRRTICAPDEPCGEILLLKDTAVLGPLIDVHLQPRRPAGNSQLAFYYKTNSLAASEIFIPGRVLAPLTSLPQDAAEADETANNTDRPLLIESTREGSIYGIAPRIISYASQALFRKNYLAAMRKRHTHDACAPNTPSTHATFHKIVTELQYELAEQYHTGGSTNNPSLVKLALPLDRKASALTWLINETCKSSGPLVLHRDAKRCGRLLGAEGRYDTLVVTHNIARDHTHRSDLRQEQCKPTSAYHYMPNVEESSIVIVGRQKDTTVKYVISPAKGAISKYDARRARLLEQVSVVCMDVDR